MIIDAVDSKVTPTTVKINRSSDRASFGNMAAIAIAAEAPQIATAPAERKAKRYLNPNIRDILSPNPMVTITDTTINIMMGNPSRVRTSPLIRTPSNATPTRNSCCELKAIPDLL
jgi:hypothetical protein